MIHRSQSLLILMGAALAVASTGLPAPAAAQNTGLVALHGTEELRGGFSPDPHTVSVRAGGRIEVNDTSLPEACAGNITDAPTYELKFAAGIGSLTFRTVSDDDTSLIINGPDGVWHCDDDSGAGLNAEVRFAPAKSGTYDVWVGSLGDAGAAATLQVTELASSTEDSDEEDTIWGDSISSEPTQLAIKVCNESGSDAFAAVSYIPIGETDFWVEGWFTVNNGACETIAHTQNTVFYVYAEARGSSGDYWGNGDATLCVVHPGPFKRVHVGGECAYGEALGQFTRIEETGMGESVWNLRR